nr:MAG TPA: histone chaperone [Caudoviricetes sp.]
MTANQNNTISDELKEEIYRVSSKLVDAQSDINDTYKYLLKRLL